MLLKQYIFDNYDKKKDFAEEQKIAPSEVSRFIREGHMVIDGRIYSFNRELIQPIKEKV